MEQPLDKLHHLIINSTNAGHFNDIRVSLWYHKFPRESY